MRTSPFGSLNPPPGAALWVSETQTKRVLRMAGGTSITAAGLGETLLRRWSSKSEKTWELILQRGRRMSVVDQSLQVFKQNVDSNRWLSKQERAILLPPAFRTWLCLLTFWLWLPLEEWIPKVFDSKGSKPKDSRDNVDIRTPASTIPCITYGDRYQYQSSQMPANMERDRANLCCLLLCEWGERESLPALLDAARQGSLRPANSKLYPLSRTIVKIIRSTAQDNSPRVASKHWISS
jgi:hypothetical protein